MTDSPHRRKQEVFIAALDLPIAARRAFVESSCGGDATMRDHVLALLAQNTSDTRFMVPLPVVALAEAASNATLGFAAGDRIGPYELIRPLGEGGFGAVWQARQQEPVAREVALKVLKLGMDTQQVVARFAQERQALACLDHPGIARVLDAGATSTGRPFFVMELVSGSPIAECCDARKLPLRDRLQLFAQICDAVQHAHGRGIIHRDLKPSNVLVVDQDGVVQAKVIDFGIAKAIGRKLTEHSLHTEDSQVIGTLEYMSPEQAGGSTDIDIRTDVWSLGVMLYELLTGRTPFAPKYDSDNWRGELLRRMHDTEPLRPSTELERAGDRLTSLAEQRRTTGNRLGSQVRGELDWIVMKALERDRSRRYATAHDFAADVRRHLAGEPIVAAPPSASYRLRKFVRKNLGLVASCAVVLLTLAGGLVLFAWQAGVAREQRDQAVLERKHSDQVQQLVLDALESADPVAGGDQGIRIVDAMARAATMLDEGRLKDQPKVELRLRVLIAKVQCNNGDAQSAVGHGERALELARSLYAGDHESLANAMQTQAKALHELGRADEASLLWRDALAMARRLWPEGHQLSVQAMQMHAMGLQSRGRAKEADALLQECLGIAQRVFPSDNWVVAGLLNQLGSVHSNAGRASLAERVLQDAVAMAKRLSPQHVRTGIFQSNLAMVLARQRRWPEATPLLRESIAIAERAFAGDHPDVLMRRSQLGQVLRESGNVDESLSIFEQTLAMSRRLYPDDHPRTAECLEQLGWAKAIRRDASAEALLTEAVEMRRRLRAEDSAELAESLSGRARAQQMLGKVADAEAGLREAMAMTRRMHQGDHENVRARVRELGLLYLRTKRPEEAMVQFSEALAMVRRLFPGSSRILASSLEDLACAVLDRGDPAESAKLYDEALAVERALPNSTAAAEAFLLAKSVSALIDDERLATRVAEVLALARDEQVPDAKSMLVALRTLTKLLARGKRLDLREEAAGAAIALGQRAFPKGDIDVALCLEERGAVAFLRNEPQAAIDSFTAALDMIAAVTPGESAARARIERRRQEAQKAMK